MLNIKVIGAGAAGNKAAINLVEKGFNINDVTLINSTAKDIPEKFRDSAIIFGQNSNTLGGCGKEREIGKKLILHDLKANLVDLDSITDPDTKAVVIVSSTEGGSGSAATPILAKYIKQVIGVPVIVCLFFGFNSDVRGMQNSIEICQELSDDYGIIGISNSKFLDSCNGNKLKAELAANDLFVEMIQALVGKDIVPGSQNIDDTDLYKLLVTPGYMNIDKANIYKIKNVDQFNKVISATIDDSKLIDISTKGAKRIGVIFDAPDSIHDYIDFSAERISQEFGLPYEMYTHVQSTKNSGTVTWIVVGMPMPLDEIKEIYEGYLQSSGDVNKKKDSFFDEVSELKGNQEDGMFNMLNSKQDSKKAKDDFFKGFGLEVKDKKPTVKTTKANSSDEY